MSEKTKRGKVMPSRLQASWFFLSWLIATIATTYLGAGIFQWLISIPAVGNLFLGASWLIPLVSSLIVGGSVAIAKKLMLRLAFGREFTGWIRASLLGIFLSILPMLLGFNYLSPNAMLMTGAFAAFLASLPLAWLLRRYVEKPWLYVLVAVLSRIFVDILFIALPFRSDFVSLSLVGVREVFFASLLLWFFRSMFWQKEAETQSESHEQSRLEDRNDEEESSSDYLGTNLAQDSQAQ